MRHRPLAIVTALAAGDYLLWNWSLGGNHDVLALVSGLTLPPLALAMAGLLALSCTRLVTDLARARGGRRPASSGDAALTSVAPHASPGSAAKTSAAATAAAKANAAAKAKADDDATASAAAKANAAATAAPTDAAEPRPRRDPSSKLAA